MDKDGNILYQSGSPILSTSDEQKGLIAPKMSTANSNSCPTDTCDCFEHKPTQNLIINEVPLENEPDEELRKDVAQEAHKVNEKIAKMVGEFLGRFKRAIIKDIHIDTQVKANETAGNFSITQSVRTDFAIFPDKMDKPNTLKEGLTIHLKRPE